MIWKGLTTYGPDGHLGHANKNIRLKSVPRNKESPYEIGLMVSDKNRFKFNMCNLWKSKGQRFLEVHILTTTRQKVFILAS